MDWTAVGTILATGAVTWGSVWLKGRYDDKADARRIENERAIAAEQQTAAEEHERAAKTEAIIERQRDAAETAMREFAAILSEMGQYDDDSTPLVIEDAWTRDHAARAYLAAELITDAHFRRHIQMANDALVNYVWFAKANEIKNWPGFSAKQHVQIMIELAGHAFRGDTPSVGLQEDLRAMEAKIEKADVAPDEDAVKEQDEEEKPPVP